MCGSAALPAGVTGHNQETVQEPKDEEMTGWEVMEPEQGVENSGEWLTDPMRTSQVVRAEGT
jgi:hypothetical protein